MDQTICCDRTTVEVYAKQCGFRSLQRDLTTSIDVGILNDLVTQDIHVAEASSGHDATNRGGTRPRSLGNTRCIHRGLEVHIIRVVDSDRTQRHTVAHGCRKIDVARPGCQYQGLEPVNSAGGSEQDVADVRAAARAHGDITSQADRGREADIVGCGSNVTGQ